jgi:hypothetical protein
VTDGYRCKLPLEKYLHSIRFFWRTKTNVEKAVDTAKKREDGARRIEELRQRQIYIAYERRKGKASADIGIEELQIVIRSSIGGANV